MIDKKIKEKIYQHDGGETYSLKIKSNKRTDVSLSSYGDNWADDCQNVVVCKLEDNGVDDSIIKIKFRDYRSSKYKVFYATCSELSDLYTMLHGIAENENYFGIPKQIDSIMN